MTSSSLSRCSRLCTVWKLVSMPPSQRWLTYGMPTRVACSAIASWPCFFVPMNRIVPPWATVSLTKSYAAVDVGQRLLQVDDVDAVALGEDESLHLRVPATGLVPEVDAALEQLAHRDDGHGSCSSRTPPASAAALPERAPVVRDDRVVGAPDAPRQRRPRRDRTASPARSSIRADCETCEVDPLSRIAVGQSTSTAGRCVHSRPATGCPRDGARAAAGWRAGGEPEMARMRSSRAAAARPAGPRCRRACVGRGRADRLGLAAAASPTRWCATSTRRPSRGCPASGASTSPAASGERVLAAGAGVVTFAGQWPGSAWCRVTSGALRTTYEPVGRSCTPASRSPAASSSDGWRSPGRSASRPPACTGACCAATTYLDPLALLGLERVRLLPLDPTYADRRRTRGRPAHGVGAAPEGIPVRPRRTSVGSDHFLTVIFLVPALPL